ncbi:MAG: hypothetical protein WDM76_08645 [Limisphaerales bacterium]
MKATIVHLELCAFDEIDLGKWEKRKYKDLVREKAGADWFEISPAERRQRAHDLGAEIGKEYEDFEVTGAVFEKLIEPTLIQPTFVTHLPKELVPLAKLSPDDPTTVEVFECCINGRRFRPATPNRTIPSHNAPRSNIRPVVNSRSWTRIFSWRSNTECHPPAASVSALIGFA